MNQQTNDMYTIRFHLGRGANYMHFQIRGYVTDSKQGDVVEYVNPNTHSLIMYGCRLHNKVNASMKIYNGHEKMPCAYVICDSYEIVPNQDAVSNVEVRFNPRVNPHWLIDGVESDFSELDCIVSSNSKLYQL